MAFVSLFGSNSTNTYGDRLHLLLSHSSIPDSLILCEFLGEAPYNRVSTGWRRSDGRTRLGSLIVVGDSFQPKAAVTCTFLVSNEGRSLFDSLLSAQQGGVAVTMSDRFSEPNDTKLVWLEVDESYISVILPKRYFQLQFSALEI